MDLSPRAFVTGAAGDIGSAICRRLAAAGMQVVGADVRPEEDIRARLAGVDGAEVVSFDLRDAAAIEDLFAAQGPFDVVVGNAALGGTSPFLTISKDLWDDSIAVNLTANFVLGQAAARSLVDHGIGGSIVFIGSWVAAVPWPEITAYTVSKAGLVMLAKQMARELASAGIRVNVVAPGIVDAGLAGHLLRTDPAYAARAGRVIPLGEFETPEQVAESVSFLCSPAGEYITGTVLTVDGVCSLFQFDRPES